MKTAITFLMLVTLISCTDKNNFKQFEELPESHQWEKNATKTFEFGIDDETKTYSISFLFSHIYGFQFNTIPVSFLLENPDGTTETINKAIVIKEKNGKDIGDCVGDVCDLKTILKENTKLQKGNYKITISNNFNGPYLPNVIGIGIQVEKQK
jgi:gliding motility-associated lipoprotein GldH